MNKPHRRFEEIPVWQDSRALCRQFYSACKTPAFRADPDLVSQSRRAVVSVLSNVAEGVERGSSDELIAFLFYAKGSCGEARAQLYVAEDQGYLSPAEAERLRALAGSISRQLSGWIKSLQTPDAPRGPRFHKESSRAEKKWEKIKRQFADSRGKKDDGRA